MALDRNTRSYGSQLNRRPWAVSVLAVAVYGQRKSAYSHRTTATPCSCRRFSPRQCLRKFLDMCQENLRAGDHRKVDIYLYRQSASPKKSGRGDCLFQASGGYKVNPKGVARGNKYNLVWIPGPPIRRAMREQTSLRNRGQKDWPPRTSD